MAKYQLYIQIDENNYIIQAQFFNKVQKVPWILVTSEKEITEQTTHGCKWQDGVFILDETKWNEYLNLKAQWAAEEALRAEQEALNAPASKADLEGVKNLKKEEIIDEYTLQLVQEGVIA